MIKLYIQTIGNYFLFYECKELETLGFSFIETSDKTRIGSNYWRKTNSPSVPKEFNSLQEVIDFTNEWGDCIINDTTLTIMDNHND